MLASVRTVALCGVQAHAVHCEADVSPGLPHTQIVGLPDLAVRESKERVQTALRNSGFEVPPARITLNLAPAELPKEGSGFDLPIALAILCASGQLQQASLDAIYFLGELSLDGRLRPVRGAIVAALHAAGDRARGLVVARANVAEARFVEGVPVTGAKSLREVVDRLVRPESLGDVETYPEQEAVRHATDLAEVRGQPAAKRALEVAAAGRHNLLLVGPPGTGKTMLVRRLPTILPELSRDMAMSASMIHSVAGTLGGRPLRVPPVRAPHHTISDVGLVGGGSPPRPGEVSLAHGGVLFLDELPEFRRAALEALRQPLEERFVTIVRARRASRFPADIQLVASMNPCPCGHSGGVDPPCRCSSADIRRYRSRVSGPLLDRIDLHVWVPPVNLDELTRAEDGEPSRRVHARVVAARERQSERGGQSEAWNSSLEGKALREACALPPGGRALLANALRRRGLSARGIHRVLRVARTIADLEGSEIVRLSHLAEAQRYRLPLAESAGGTASFSTSAR